MVLQNALIFLIQVVFTFYLYLLMLRLWMQRYRASAVNPLSQFVIRITNPCVKPLQRLLTGFRGFDFSIILAMFVIQLLEVFLQVLITAHVLPGWLGLIVVVVGELFSLLTNFFFFMVIIAAIMSWFASARHNPLADVVRLIADPLMNIVRAVIPPIAGFDLSPIVILVVLKLIDIVIIAPIIAFGFNLMLK